MIRHVFEECQDSVCVQLQDGDKYIVSRQVLSDIDASCIRIESCTTRILYNAAECWLSCVD